MSVEELAPPQVSSEPQQQWPDGVPAVALDIRLGKKNSNIDVDPYQLHGLLVDQGAEPNALADTTVVLKPKAFVRPGQYDPRTKTATIPINKIGKTLAHEGQHLADDTRGELDHYEGAIRIITGTALGVAATGLAMYVGAKNGVEIPPPAITLTTALSGGMWGRSIAYRTGADERRAFESGNDPYLVKMAENVFDVTPKK